MTTEQTATRIGPFVWRGSCPGGEMGWHDPDPYLVDRVTASRVYVWRDQILTLDLGRGVAPENARRDPDATRFILDRQELETTGSAWCRQQHGQFFLNRADADPRTQRLDT